MTAQAPMDSAEMSQASRIFTTAATSGRGARLGRLALPGRKAFDTPNYMSVASRGVVPHITPDNISKHTSMVPTYMALEDFIERKQPPIHDTPSTTTLRTNPGSKLHSFTALPSSVPTIMAARRCPPVTAPQGNTSKSVTLFTSTGFRNITVPEFASAVASLRPDVIVPMADLLHTSTTPPSKKLVRMAERTEEWLDEFLRLTDTGAQAVFAPVLAVEYPIQWDYLRHLAQDVRESLSGLAVYDTNLLPSLGDYPSLGSLPKLSLEPPKSPHDILQQISLGVDVCVAPFINAVSDAGVAMTFQFPAPSPAKEAIPAPLGVDMWSEEHSTSLTPLLEGCNCYACTSHHRAYMRHLLNAKEMLGWNLLQLHNHFTVDCFFRGVRESLQNGSFEAEKTRFLAAYGVDFPQGTGERPRARGYHFKSEAAQEKINKTTWKELNAHSVTGGVPEDKMA